MKPNFALSLSFEGIRLLHRAAGGWRRVGEVSVTSSALASDLSDLRKAAEALDKGPVRTKLIIPDDQIKYLSVDTGSIDSDARRDAARAALDGATPYAVDALKIDICEDGDTTHVAAVARETLAEAEAFASEHSFHPVCFVAAPQDQGFLGEPWFGQSAYAKSILAEGEEVTPDGVRVVVIGDVDAAPETELPAAEEPAEDTSDVAPQDPPPLKFSPVDEEPTEDDRGADVDDGLTAPTLGFASRRSGTAIPIELGGVTRDTYDVTASSAPVLHRPGDAPAQPPAEISESFNTPAAVARENTPAPRGTMGRFFSRRSAQPAVAAGIVPVDAEAQRLTIFGARGGVQIGGKPRFLGLILTAILIASMVGVAALASVYLDDRISGLFQRERTLASTLPDDIAADLVEDVGATTRVDPAEETSAEGVAVASLNEDLADGLSEEDAAVLDALRAPLPAPQAPEELDAAALDARYAVTGIWPKAPEVPSAPPLIPLEDFYLTSIDPVSPALDAVALPGMSSVFTDAALPNVADPPAPGTDIARNDNGLIVPSPEGVVSPDGYTIVLAPPPAKPPLPLARETVAALPEPADNGLAEARPRARPEDLAEQNERATLGGLLRTELATYRPKLRPPAPQEVTEPPEADPVPEADIDEALAAAALPPADPVLRPAARPRNFDRIVTRAQRRQNRGSTVTTGTRVASVAPRAVTPSIPSSASVTREATVRNAINLRRVNLIGVYGTPSDRRALVRLANGRYQKVQVGDRFDGGRVSAIGDSELRYQKGGRNLVLKMPSG